MKLKRLWHIALTTLILTNVSFAVGNLDPLEERNAQKRALKGHSETTG